MLLTLHFALCYLQISFSKQCGNSLMGFLQTAKTDRVPSSLNDKPLKEGNSLPQSQRKMTRKFVLGVLKKYQLLNSSCDMALASKFLS